jgi:hypothetical protein
MHPSPNVDTVPTAAGAPAGIVVARTLIGILTVLALVYFSLNLQSRLEAAPRDVSARQIIQVYTESLVQGSVTLAMRGAAYILTRACE